MQPGIFRWSLSVFCVGFLACDPSEPTRPETSKPDSSAGSATEPASQVDSPRARTKDEQAMLEALGYAISGETASGPTGVTLHDEERALGGWNLYMSTLGLEAVLIDMKGRVLHRWRGRSTPADRRKKRKLGLWWRRTQLFPNGDLLALSDYGARMKLDAESRRIWVYDAACHHDFDIAPDGRIFTLMGTDPIQQPGFDQPLSEDFVVELGPNGVERKRVSLLDALVRGGQKSAMRELREYQNHAKDPIDAQDLTHLNALEILRAPPPKFPEAFQKGRLLLSTPKNHRLMLMDFARGEVVWSMNGSFRYQHDPTLTQDGRLLLFDNQGAADQRSRVLEVDPAAGTKVWSYGDVPDPLFFSKCCGRVHALANGNLLAIVSMEGRAIEITPDGEIVWEFRIPDVIDGKTAILNDLVRIDPTSLDADFVSRLQRAKR